MFPEYLQFHNPTRVIFGKGISSNFSSELDIIGKSKYFNISDMIITSETSNFTVELGNKNHEIEKGINDFSEITDIVDDFSQNNRILLET